MNIARLAGICYLLTFVTFGAAAIAKALYPYNLAPGIIGEGALTIWLLAVRVNVPSRARSAS